MNPDYVIWLNTVDEDGDYGLVKLCGNCGNKKYKCSCIDLSFKEEAK